MAVWKKKWWHPKRKITPQDAISYKITSDVVAFTERILKEYDPHEGIVYWAGTTQGNDVVIDMAVAPKASTHEGQFAVDHLSNAKVIVTLHDHTRTHLAQVHSHPSTCIDHSGLDDQQAAFRKEGLLSLVVPSYCRTGMKPMPVCGIHRFRKKTFYRLSNKYIDSHFQIIKSDNSVLIDLRNGKAKYS